MEEILVQFRANIEGFKKDLADVKKQLADVDKTGKTTGENLGKNLKNVGSSAQDIKSGLLEIGKAVGIAFAVHEVINFGKESVKAFIEAEENATRLKFALTQIGKEGELAFKKLIEQSEKLQAQSIFSDDDIQKAQTALATFGLTSKEIEKLIPKVIDLASATDKDLGNAVTKTTQALNGQMRDFKRLRIDFKDTNTITGNLALVMGKLGKFSGAAGDALATTAGRARSASNTFNNLQESIGKAILQSTEFKTGIDLLDLTFGSLTFQQLKEREVLEQLGKVADIVFAKFVEGSAAVKSSILQSKIALGEKLSTSLSQSGAKDPQHEAKLLALKANTDLLRRLTEESNASLAKGRTAAEDATAKGLAAGDDAAKKSAELKKKLADDVLQATIDSSEQANKDAEDMLAQEFARVKANGELIIAQTKADSQERLDAQITAIETERDFRLNTEQLTQAEIETINTEALIKITDLKVAQKQKEQDAIAELEAMDLERRLDAIDVELEAFEEAEMLKQEIRQTSVEAGQEGVNTLFEIKRNADDKEMMNLKSNLDQQIISQQQYDAAVKEIKLKQAKRDKAQALFNIGIQTAENIVKAFPNVILQALAAAIGALQASVVASKPLNFYEGTEYVEQGKHKRGRDTIPAMINIGERIITTKDNEKNWDVYESLRLGKFEKYIQLNYVAPIISEQLNKKEKRKSSDFADNIVTSMIYNTQNLDTKDLAKVLKKGIYVKNMPDDEGKISYKELEYLQRMKQL